MRVARVWALLAAIRLHLDPFTAFGLFLNCHGHAYVRYCVMVRGVHIESICIACMHTS